MKKAIFSVTMVIVLLATGLVMAKSNRAKEPVYSEPVTRQFSQNTTFLGGLPATITVVASSSDEGRVNALMGQVLSGAAQLDVELNVPETGEIAKINASGGKKIVLSENAFALISKANNLAAVTNGWFDITTPSEKSLFSAKDYRKIKLNKSDRSLVLKGSGMKLDVSNIWPAYLADLLLAHIAKEGFSNIKVDVGNVSCNIGQDIHTPWYVAIDIPNPEADYAHRSQMYSFSNKAVTVVKPENITTPLIDPKSKEPVPNNFRNITVFGNDSMTSSALAYAIYTLGPRVLATFTEQHPEIKGIFVDNEGNFITSKNMKLSRPAYGAEEPATAPAIDRGPNDLKQKKFEEEKE